MTTRIKRSRFMSLAMILIFVLFTVATSIFLFYTINTFSSSTDDLLYSISAQKVQSIENQIKSDVSTVTGFASTVYDYKTTDVTTLRVKMKNICLNSGMTNVIIIDEKGMAMSYKDELIDVSAREYFTRSMQGEIVLSDPIYSEPDSSMVNVISAPIFGDYQRIIGVVAAILPKDRYTASLDLSITDNNHNQSATGYIVCSEGNIVFQGNNVHAPYVPFEGNFFKSEFFKDYSEKEITHIKDEFQKKGSLGVLRANDSNGNGYVAYYKTLDVDAHYHYVAVFSEQSVSGEVDRYTRNIIILFGAFIFILLFFILVYIFFIKKGMNELKSANENMKRIAYIDSLTGYGTWEKFVLDTEKLIKNDYRRYSLVSFDIDKFKAINDMFGHEEGNRILKMIADTVDRYMNKNTETFSRIGSDNFYLLINYQEDKDITDRIREIINAIEYEIEDFVPVISFGIYKIVNKNLSIRKMGDFADIAKRTVKYGNDSAWAFFNENMVEQMREEKKIENEMQSALDTHEFCVFFQPKVSLTGNTVLMGAEALVRWIKDDTVISPAKFIPLFEKNRFIIKLDYYVMDQVCRMIKKWEQLGYSDVLISVNMSRHHLDDPDFAAKLNEICEQHNVKTSKIEIEITESAAYESLDTLIKVFDRLKSYGFYISIDDFGSGYSSLNMLKDLQADVLKIDRVFLTESGNNIRANNIIAYVIQMARSLGMETICEGIETEEQVQLLRSLGCDMAQGYFYAKPMPVEAFEEILQGQHSTILLEKNTTDEINELNLN